MIIFVGDQPSPKMKPGAKAFEGAVCEPRLKEWVGYLTEGKDHDIINSTDTKTLSEYIYRAQKEPMKFVALGNTASFVLKAMMVEHYKLLHPSGKNRMLNFTSLIEKKLTSCKEWLQS